MLIMLSTNKRLFERSNLDDQSRLQNGYHQKVEKSKGKSKGRSALQKAYDL